jgi:hypothetical protein
VIDVPETLHSQRERGRLHAQGRRTDHNTGCTAAGDPRSGQFVGDFTAWAYPECDKAEMIALAEAILGRAR